VQKSANNKFQEQNLFLEEKKSVHKFMEEKKISTQQAPRTTISKEQVP